jgi:hypothetical protein
MADPDDVVVQGKAGKNELRATDEGASSVNRVREDSRELL